MTKVLREQVVSKSPIYGERGLSHTDKQKAEVFADNLECQCSPNYANVDGDYISRVNRRLKIALRKREGQEGSGSGQN